MFDSIIAHYHGRARTEPRPVARPHLRDNQAAGFSLLLGALGVVYGDIGTSPLYAIQTVFTLDHGRVSPSAPNVYGIISLVFWSIAIVVSTKYVSVVMRADNAGEGGVLALAELARRALSTSRRRAAAVMILGLLGACLFYGDSVITPAISVLSAVEGLKVPYPGLTHLVVPLAAVILTVLFVVQRRGTHRVGSFFGPIMVAWFAAIGAAGAAQLAARPRIIMGLSPTYAAAFVIGHPGLAFVAMGAVVLAITGAEALYADMGHFGRRPIRRAWFALVFPALTLNYLGQGSLIVAHHADVTNPFFLMLPHWATLPMIVLATLATVIASQAVVTGAFSMTRQAHQLGFLPALTIRQTSEHEAGQIYLPGVNWLLYVGVMALIVMFRSSASLANAYGVAVTGTFVLTTIMLMTLARASWGWSPTRVAALGAVFGLLEVTFFAGNVVKVVSGGWLPLLIATALFTLMTTWRKGREVVTTRRLEREGSLQDFVSAVNAYQVTRVPGTAVFPHPSSETTPLALRANVEHNGVLHAHVLLVSAKAHNVPHIDPADRVSVDDLGDPCDGIVHITLNFGFFDTPDIPAALCQARSHPLLADASFTDASYFLSRAALHRCSDKTMASWRKRLFIAMAHNAADPAEVFCLPTGSTVVMGGRLDI